MILQRQHIHRVVLCLPFLIDLEFGKCQFFMRGENRSTRKNLSEQSRERTNSTHIWHRVRESIPGHTGGRRVLSPLRQPCSSELERKCIFRWYVNNSLQEFLSHFLIGYWIPYILQHEVLLSLSRNLFSDVTIRFVLEAVMSDSETNIEGTKEKVTPENPKTQSSKLVVRKFFPCLRDISTHNSKPRES